MVPLRLTDAVASGDCERIHDGLIAEPINSVSSLAYVVAGAILLARARGLPRGSRGWPVAFALVTAANGFGGVAYHGPGGTASRWLHDAAIVATLVLVIVTARRVIAAVRGVEAARLLFVGALAAGLYLTSRTGGSLCAPDSVFQGHAGWHVLTALLLFWWGEAAFASRRA